MDKYVYDLDDELLREAIEAVRGNGENDVSAKRARRMILAISLDNRRTLGEYGKRLHEVENHFLHKLTPKRVGIIVSIFGALSGVYIKETRDLLIAAIRAILGI